MSVVLEDTGIKKMLGMLEWVRVDMPRTTTALGVTLLTGAIAVHLYLLLGEYSWPPAWMAYYSILAAGWAVAAAVMSAGRRPAFVRAAWFLGDFMCVVFLALYIIGRFVGLPGLPDVVNWWDFTAGTFAMAFTAGFLGLHLSILFGIFVARPWQRDWYD